MPSADMFPCEIYTAHKKITNSIGCHGYDPYSAILSTGRCQDTLVYKSAE